MVFVPTHHNPVEPHEAAATPRRPDQLKVPARRLAWRAVVHSNADKSVQTSWHLAGCASPPEPQAHCPEGQNLMQAQHDPDGHCLVDGRCGRCDDAT